MPTVLFINGYKFFFYANEHLPKHIHVVKGDNFAKINVESMEIIVNYFKQKDLKFILKTIKENRNFILEKWDEYFKR